MAGKIQSDQGPSESGHTEYLVVRQQGQSYNTVGDALEDHEDANWADYAIEFEDELGVTGSYIFQFPTTLPLGKYNITLYLQAGGSPAVSDIVVDRGTFDWDGSEEASDLDLETVDSFLDIINMALSNLGVGEEIASLDTEDSEEARVIRRYYATVRDATLRDKRWPFATKIDDLALVETDPNDEWAYSYRYPSDCIKMRKILGSLRVRQRGADIAFQIGRDASGPLIFTDQPNAQAEYTMRVTNTTMFPADFRLSLACRLSAYIAPRLAKDALSKFGDRSLKLFQLEIGQAAANAFNEQQDEPESESEFITGR